MVLKLAILVAVVLCFYDQKASATAEFKLVTCKPIEKIENGYIGYYSKNGRIHGVDSTAYLICHRHHILVGNNVTKCNYSGFWQPSLGACILNPKINTTYCKPYTTQYMPSLHYKPALKAVPLGSTVTLKCPDGQRLFGNMESKCVKGIWKPLLGTCVDDKRILKECAFFQQHIAPCPPPKLSIPYIAYKPEVINLKELKYPHGTVAMLICPANHYLEVEGSRWRICKNGTWSGPFGQCKPLGT